MKKKKINLDTLKVQSFVTDLEEESSETIKGGGFLSVIGCTGGGGNCSGRCGSTTSGGQNPYIIEICDNPV